MNPVRGTVANVKTWPIGRTGVEVASGDKLSSLSHEPRPEIFKCLFCHGSGHTQETILTPDGGIHEALCPCCGGRGIIRMEGRPVGWKP